MHLLLLHSYLIFNMMTVMTINTNNIVSMAGKPCVSKRLISLRTHNSPCQPHSGESLGMALDFPGQEIPDQLSASSFLYSFINLKRRGNESFQNSFNNSNATLLWEVGEVGVSCAIFRFKAPSRRTIVFTCLRLCQVKIYKFGHILCNSWLHGTAVDITVGCRKKNFNGTTYLTMG